MVLPPQDQTQVELRGFEAADGEQTQRPVAAAPPPSWEPQLEEQSCTLENDSPQKAALVYLLLGNLVKSGDLGSDS